MKGESRYAEQLMKLGFKKAPPETGHAKYPMVEAYIRSQPRRERRRLSKEMKKLVAQPSFSIVKDESGTYTCATDETGHHWEAVGAIDLFPLGFINNPEWMAHHLAPANKSKMS